MEILGAIFDFVMAILQMPFTIWGVELSLWQIFVFTVVIDVIGLFVWRVLLDD